MRRKSLFSINGLTSVRRCGTLGLLALFVEAGSGFKRATAQQADLEPKTILGQEDSRPPKCPINKPDLNSGGIRFLLSKKYHVNLRADAAIGKSSHTWALGVGEAF